MTTLTDSPTIGLEMIARQGLIVLMETLNDELVTQEEIWKPRDEELAEKRGIDFAEITLEPVQPENFYPGHKPSLIEAPLDGYPNVTVEADAAGPSTSDLLDQAATYGVSLYVEFMVKSVESEEEVSARAQRMLDAINVCMLSNRTLRGVVLEIGDTPNVAVADVFVRKAETSYGDKWFWRGGRLEYAVEKIAAMPSGDSSRPASILPDIDQS